MRPPRPRAPSQRRARPPPMRVGYTAIREKAEMSGPSSSAGGEDAARGRRSGSAQSGRFCAEMMSSAERIAILRADDGGFQRRRFGAASAIQVAQNDRQLSTMSAGRSRARSLRRGRRLEFAVPVAKGLAVNVLVPRIERGGRLFPLLPATKLTFNLSPTCTRRGKRDCAR